MAAHGKRGRRGGAVEAENEERWLLTYADMLTLLFALFMVLFSISSVNISKYQVLQQSLKAAFSGSVLPGGRAILQSGSESTSAHTPATAEVPSIVPLVPTPTSRSSSSTGSANTASAKPMTLGTAAGGAQQHERFGLRAGHVREAQASRSTPTRRRTASATRSRRSIERRGLVVRVLTDNLLFDSGSATLQPGADQLLDEVGQLLNLDKSHPITVEGHTDNQPIANAQFPSNWELSTTRATNVVRFLISQGVSAYRLGAVGYADLHPIASNATAAGRAQNRRVEIVLMRLNPVPPS